MGTTKIKKELNTYITRLKKAVDPEKVILFGSFARNIANEWSDIDILVVSRFKNIPEKKRDLIIYKLSRGLIKDHDYNTYAVTPEEFNRAKPWSIFSEIKREGIILYSKN